MRQNNECEYLVLSPLDGHYIEAGKWEYITPSKVIKIYDLQDELYKELKVIELTDDLLNVE